MLVFLVIINIPNHIFIRKIFVTYHNDKIYVIVVENVRFKENNS